VLIILLYDLLLIFTSQQTRVSETVSLSLSLCVEPNSVIVRNNWMRSECSRIDYCCQWERDEQRNKKWKSHFSLALTLSLSFVSHVLRSWRLCSRSVISSFKYFKTIFSLLPICLCVLSVNDNELVLITHSLNQSIMTDLMFSEGPWSQWNSHRLFSSKGSFFSSFFSLVSMKYSIERKINSCTLLPFW
jgi:hypothetical protein